MADNGWMRGRWWRVLDDNGNLWMETSNPREVIECMEEFPTYTLLKWWWREQGEWRPEQLATVEAKVSHG
jgi:hypothetical protein